MPRSGAEARAVSPPERWQAGETVYGSERVMLHRHHLQCPWSSKSSFMKPVPLYGKVHQKEMENDGNSVVWTMCVCMCARTYVL